MSTIDNIRDLCIKNGISISKLEKELGFSNSSLTKSKNIGYDRIQKIANYFNVSTDVLSDTPKKKLEAVYRSGSVSERPKRGHSSNSEYLNQDTQNNIIDGTKVMPKSTPKELFDINKVELLREFVDSIENNPYYTDAYSQELAQFAHDNPNYRVLFDASRKVKPENISKVMAMLKIMGDDEE